MPIHQTIIQTECNFKSIEIEYSYTSFSMLYICSVISRAHLVQRVEYSGKTMSMQWLLISWLHASQIPPNYRHRCKLNRPLYSMMKDFNCLANPGLTMQCKYIFIFPRKIRRLEFTTILYMGSRMWCFSRFKMSLILSTRLWWNLEIQSYFAYVNWFRLGHLNSQSRLLFYPKIFLDDFKPQEWMNQVTKMKITWWTSLCGAVDTAVKYPGNWIIINLNLRLLFRT